MFEDLLAKLAISLSKHNIPYMLIGGQAVLLYGEPRLTRDIDVTLGLDAKGLPLVLTATKELRLKPLPKEVNEFVQKTMVLPTEDEETGIRVDFIFSFTPYERQAIDRAKAIKIKDTFVRFASVEDVIIHKIFAGRPRDLEDVKAILLKNPSIDIPYVKQWLKEFDESLSEQNFLNIFEEILNLTRFVF